MEGNALIWVKDDAGNRFLCPLNALRDPNSLIEGEKRGCVDNAGRLDHPETVPGAMKIRFSPSASLS